MSGLSILWPPRSGRRLTASVIVDGVDITPIVDVVSWASGTDEEALDDAEEKRARKAAKRLRDAERVAAGRKGGA